MKYLVDGNQLVITLDDFINLQESPAVFIDAGSEIGQTIQHGGIGAMPFSALRKVFALLQNGGGEMGPAMTDDY